MEDTSSRKYFDKRLGALKTERSSFISHWRDLSEYVQPRRGRFLLTDQNKGERRSSKIINSHATRALRIAVSGMHAGIMSPARPWFTLETPDKDMMKFAPVKVWLEVVSDRMRAIFNASNLYRMAPVLIQEALLFGTGLMTHEDDFEDVARFYTHTAGSFMIDQDDRYEVNTVYREYQESVGRIVKRFGLENASQFVKTQFSNGNYSTWAPLVHAIEPNAKHRTGNPFSKRFRSVYYEPGNAVEKEQFLEDKGFFEFPGYCLRWEVTGEDVYGTNCPGMTALGDVMALQLMERRKAQAIDKMTNPPLRGPASLKNTPISSLPGGTNLYDGDATGGKLEPVYQVNPDIQGISIDIERNERRIDSDFHVDLFRAITEMEGIQPRNEMDLAQRNEERLLQLGPTLERFHGEFLTKMIDRTFNQMVRASNFERGVGIIPPPPAELQQQELKVNYISPLAMAQRSVALGGIDRLTGYVAGLVQAGFVEAADKIDADEAVNEYAKALGTPARLIASDDEVTAKRTDRRKRQAMEQAVQLGQGAAQVAKTAADASTEGSNLLTNLSDTVRGRRQ